jgi:hypothetical protein
LDYSDFRDLTMDDNKVSAKLKAMGQKDSIKTMLGKTVLAKAAGTLPSHKGIPETSSNGNIEHVLIHKPCLRS